MEHTARYRQRYQATLIRFLFGEFGIKRSRLAIISWVTYLAVYIRSIFNIMAGLSRSQDSDILKSNDDTASLLSTVNSSTMMPWTSENNDQRSGNFHARILSRELMYHEIVKFSFLSSMKRITSTHLFHVIKVEKIL